MVFVRADGSAWRAVAASQQDTVASVCGDAAAAVQQGALRVMCDGRTLDPRASLAAAGVQPAASLQLLPRLRGGGGDGGSTGAESRSCYLEMYAGRKADKVNPEEERLARWTSCQLSGMPLAPPCVADELGSLFNKDAVLQALLTKSMPKSLGHISSLKHVTELKLVPAPDGGDGFVCPVTGQALSAKGGFVLFRGTGHVVSERALKEVPAVVEELVGGKWRPTDLLPINPTGAELQAMREGLLLSRAAERAAKKEKKGRGKAGGAAAPAESGVAAAATAATAANGKRGAAAAAAADVPAEAPAAAAAPGGKRFKAAELKPKHADDRVWNSLFTSSQPADAGRGTDYMCRAASRYVM